MRFIFQNDISQMAATVTIAAPYPFHEIFHDQFAHFIFSDEVHFHSILSRIVGFGAQKIQEWWLKSLSITVWSGFWAGGVIGPYFFENEVGATVTVNGWRYRATINEFLWPELECGRRLFSARRRYVPHKQRNNRNVARKVSGPCYFSMRWSQLATEILWFNIFRVFSLGPRKR